MAWVEPEDIVARWVGDNAPDELTLIPLIQDAEVIIRYNFPTIDERLAEEEPTLAERIEFVVSRMVIRAVRNPEGLRSIQDGAGPFQTTRTFGGAEPGTLWLTDEEHDLLAASDATRVARGRAFAIDTGSPRSGVRHLDICSVHWGGDCSCGAVLLGGGGW